MKTLLATLVAGISFFALASVSPALASDTGIYGNGALSDNRVSYNASNTTSVNQTNNTDINNNVTVSNNTGHNTASGNTGGNVSIQTGDANANVSISNMAGVNIANLSGQPMNNNASIDIMGNGAFSNNAVNYFNRTSTTLNQSNDTRIANNVDVNNNTGYNTVNNNTGSYNWPWMRDNHNNGSTTISTGNANASVSIENKGNVNAAYVSGTQNNDSHILIAGNGAYSDNAARLNDTNYNRDNQNNDNHFNNDVNTHNNSGYNNWYDQNNQHNNDWYTNWYKQNQMNWLNNQDHKDRYNYNRNYQSYYPVQKYFNNYPINNYLRNYYPVNYDRYVNNYTNNNQDCPRQYLPMYYRNDYHNNNNCECQTRNITPAKVTVIPLVRYYTYPVYRPTYLTYQKPVKFQENKNEYRKIAYYPKWYKNTVTSTRYYPMFKQLNRNNYLTNYLPYFYGGNSHKGNVSRTTGNAYSNFGMHNLAANYHNYR